MCKMKDIKNLKVGKLLVLNRVDKPTTMINNYKGVYWQCLCDCGNKKIVSSKDLVRSNVKSCGCAKLGVNFKGYGEIPHSIYSHIIISAKKRNIEFNITIEYIWNLFLKQDRKCAYTGEVLKFSKNKNDSSKTASLDRIDSSKGYIEGNVIWCHKKINILKMNIPLDEFYMLCTAVNNYKENSKNIISKVGKYKDAELYALEITTQTLIK